LDYLGLSWIILDYQQLFECSRFDLGAPILSGPALGHGLRGTQEMMADVPVFFGEIYSDMLGRSMGDLQEKT